MQLDMNNYSIGQKIPGLLPNIYGTWGINGTWYTASGSFSVGSSGSEGHGWNGSSSTRALYTFNATSSSSIYQSGVYNVIPSSINLYYIIRY